MLYQGYQAYSDMMWPSRRLAKAAIDIWEKWLPDLKDEPLPRRLRALAEVYTRAEITHARPPFHIDQVPVGNALTPVIEEVALDMPFMRLLHFTKPEVTVPQPKMLVVTPLSGHYSTLLRNTAETLLRDHDVYVTDWKNARDVPLSAGRFGLDEYVDDVIAAIRHLGPRSHLIAVCQPCVPALVAVSLMAQDQDPCQPRTMTLMGGPIDVYAAPTIVNELAFAHPLEWFKKNLIATVPLRYPGAGRKVYPGFLQLTAFMSMNMGRHVGQFRKLYQDLADGKTEDAHKIEEFYEEYFAVLDLTADFYLETVDKVFQRALLAKGELTHRGRLVDPGAIRRTALLTVEGERDDICAVGQTAAAHLLCTGLRPHLKRHHLQPGVGHYGVFSGSRWEKQVYPQVRHHVLAMS